MTVLIVHEFGDPAGEPLLAVHGITAHGRRFRRLAEEAWPERRTIAVDLRGHGYSTYDGPWSIQQHVTDLIDTLDALGIDRLDVVGHSYGGVIALRLLERLPHVVKRLVMLDPALIPTGASATENAMRTIADPGFATIDEARVARNQGLGDEINPAIEAEVVDHLFLDEDGRYRWRYHKPAVVTGWGEVCYPLPTYLERRPTLLVVATKAELVTPEAETGLAELFGDDLTTVRLDCGHMLYWEMFDETAAAVTEFFALPR
jgi:lipase